MDKPLTTELAAVKLGDTIRFSVALVKQIYEAPDHLSIRLVLRGISVEDDGSKILMVEVERNDAADSAEDAWRTR